MAARSRGLWLGIAAVLLIIVVQDVAWRETGMAIMKLRGWQVFVLIVANGLVLGTLYSRWAVIMQAQGYPISFYEIAKISLAGFAVSYLTPGPQFGGEPVQVYLLYRDHQVPLTAATAGVALDKTLTLLTSFAFLFLGILFVIQGQLFNRVYTIQALVVAALLFAIPFLLLLSWWGEAQPLARFTQLISTFAPRFRHWETIVGRIEQEMSTFYRQHPKAFALALALSILSWVALAAEYWLMAHFLGLRMTPWQAVALLTAVRVAFLLPLPAAVGSLEAAQVWALEAMGLPTALGISLSLLIRGRDFSLALVGLWWSGITLGNTKLKAQTPH